MRRSAVALATLVALIPLPGTVLAQARPTYPERAIRRDIPLTDMIRRAFAAGTRDSTGRPGPHYWQLWTDYTITARLDPATGVVTGHERVVVQNPSDSAMREVVLRLDQNLFGPGAPRADVVPGMRETDGMRVTSLTIDGQAVDPNPQPTLRTITRGGNSFQVTVPPPYDLRLTSARIPLATPVPAHGSFTLEADWHFTVPQIPPNTRGVRMGAWGDSLFQVAQWYPRVAVFDDLREGGWDTEPYLGFSEFYNNFGRFDVALDVPAGWLVGATGVLQNPGEVLTAAARERLSHVLESDSTLSIVGPDDVGPGKSTAAGDRLVWHFAADTAGDFAWATSSRYVWDATRATIPGKGPVPVNMLYVPWRARQFAQAATIARHALQFYSGLWIPYSFPVLTLADGPENGMEYPMIIFSAAGASDHEAGHEWWPMTLGTNETWYPFMDEGFNQYMNILSGADRAGQPAELDGVGEEYGRTSGDEREAPLMWDANYGGPMYVFQGYAKAPMMLSMLGGIVGDSAVQRAMREYAQSWRFKHPSPWDYAFSMDRSLGQDLGWFWYSWLFTTESVDGSIADARIRGGRATVTVREDGQMPSPVVLAVHFAPKGPRLRAMKGARIVDDSTAIVTWPVDVWFGGSRTFEAKLDFGARRIERIVFDPHCRFPDHDAADNVWPRQAAPAQPAGGQGFGRFGPPECRG
ncbi:MAG TPA: M1 family metallopeptidase [Gemmatimonadales bacterium]|nr:M1 family metallopeptidase [Gemmatimonadales bacterium]